MSKTSKPRDLWRHVYAAAADRPDTWCKGCGYFRVAHSAHRADCTTEEWTQCRDCGAELLRSDSVTAGICLECRLCGDDTDSDVAVADRFCLDCAKPSRTPFCPTCLAMIIEDSRTGEVECWIGVPGWESQYQVSSFGRVRSPDRFLMGYSPRGRAPQRFTKSSAGCLMLSSSA